MKISNTLKDLSKIDYRELKPIQGSLKTLSPENEEKLLKSLTKFGFIVPLFIWKNGEEIFLIDGHQRHTVMMHNEIKPFRLPYVEIEAETEQEAKEKLLVISSQYGTINQEGYDEFVMDFSDSDIEDIVNFDLLFDKDKIKVGNEEIDIIDKEVIFANELGMSDKYLIIKFSDNEEYEEAKLQLKLKKVTENNHKKIDLNNKGIETVIKWDDFKNKLNDNSNPI